MLKIVDRYKYLGLCLDTKFSFKEHMSKMLEKARKRMRAICALGLKKGISAKAVLRGWEVLVRPIIEYGAEIWERRKKLDPERMVT